MSAINDYVIYILRYQSERKQLWDEENRLRAIDDNGFISCYFYDASGNRTIKLTGGSGHGYVNGEKVTSPDRTETRNCIIYPNANTVFNFVDGPQNAGWLSRHIYAGSERVMTVVSLRKPVLSRANSALKQTLEAKKGTLEAEVGLIYSQCEVPFSGEDNNAQSTGTWNDAETVYFYHPDHLGSTTLVTDATGSPTQRVEYAPFGELFIDKRQGDTWHTPYLFNAKEYDEETGLYYYGARYYDPHLSLWLSPDPMERMHPDISPYCYTLNNPLNYIDLGGKIEWPVDKVYNGQPRRHENNFMKNRIHRGIDINIGSKDHDLGAPVYATHDGKVVRIATYNDDRNAGGTRIKIQSKDGKVATFYMHLQSISRDISLNAEVSEGQQIGTLGKSADGQLEVSKFSAHLHYELFIDGTQVNPVINDNRLVNPQLLIGGSNDDRSYIGPTLDEVIIIEKANQPKMEKPVIQVDLNRPSNTPKINTNVSTN